MYATTSMNLKNIMQFKKARHKRPGIVWLHLYEMSRMSISTKTENRFMAARGWEQTKWGTTEHGTWVCISFGGEWKCSKIRQCRWLYNFVNTPKPTELYTLKRWILLCVNYISLKLLFFKRHFKMFDFLQWWDPLTILFTSFLVLDLKSAIANTLRLNSFRDFTLSEDDLAWHLGLQILQHFSHCYLWN